MFRPVTITAVLNGWIVTCGCQTVVYQERNQLVSELDAYLKDPDATEARFLKSAVNQAHTYGNALATACEPPRHIDRRERERDACASAGTSQPMGVTLRG